MLFSYVMEYGVPGQLYQNEYGLKSSVFRDITPCNLVKVNWQAASIGVLATCFMLVDFLLGILFDPDDGCDTLVDSPDYMIYPRCWNSSQSTLWEPQIQ
jgi:hypothetical protein